MHEAPGLKARPRRRACLRSRQLERSRPHCGREVLPHPAPHLPRARLHKPVLVCQPGLGADRLGVGAVEHVQPLGRGCAEVQLHVSKVELSVCAQVLPLYQATPLSGEVDGADAVALVVAAGLAADAVREEHATPDQEAAKEGECRGRRCPVRMPLNLPLLKDKEAKAGGLKARQRTARDKGRKGLQQVNVGIEGHCPFH
mmetsp:Transcript_71865/g.227055  ORF Transcript_71865/g.227055 Transcript_71865/m.227055 type:complete len:200 (-) Transcript_71865:185-784(-)